ncbi:hypothetical protein WMF04_08030 [Sorangium sp. So ce260]|uniref:hypothetical protein n=1 Tax=Sorangium sp. So ce260 TaxID=3133291 RepID=UPI003F60A695
MTFLVTLAACSVEIVDGGGTGAGGGGTGTGGTGTGGTGTGGTGAGGTGAGGTGAGGTGTAGTGTAGTGAGGTGAGGAGTGGGPACEAHEPRVFACADVDLRDDEDPLTPRTFAFSGTVTAVRPPSPDEPCARNADAIGSAAPEVMIDLADEAGNPLTVGFTVPGFASSAVAVGDTLDLDLSTSTILDFALNKVIRIRLDREGELVVAVGQNDPIGLTVGDGERACYREDDLCGFEKLAMTVSVDGEPAISIPNGESAEVGELTVTNDTYFKNYDISGACNFGRPVEYIVSAAATP